MEDLRLRPEALVWREIDNELVAVDMASSTYLSANQSGALLWQMLAAGTTRDELVERLVDRFGISFDRAADDVDAFLDAVEQDTPEHVRRVHEEHLAILDAIRAREPERAVHDMERHIAAARDFVLERQEIASARPDIQRRKA